MKRLIFLVAALTIFALYLENVDGQVKLKAQTLGEKVQSLLDMNAKKSVLKFNSNTFREFVESVPRNYSIVILFTAMTPARQCVNCRQASDEYTIVANSYRFSQSYSNKLFFAMIDIDDGSDVFQMLRLNTSEVMHFPARSNRTGPDVMNIQRVGFSAKSIAKFCMKHTDISIRIFRPPNYSGTVAVLMLGLLVVGSLYLCRIDFLYDKHLWSILAVVFCFAMVSGQMWNHIRSPPFVKIGHNGGVVCINRAPKQQLVIETYIVMFLYAMIIVGMILLTEAGRQIDKLKGQIMAFVGLVLVTIFFSLILWVFRVKYQRYPYSFLFK